MLPLEKRVPVEGAAGIQIVIQTFKSKRVARKMYLVVTRLMTMILYNSWMVLPRNRLGVLRSDHRHRLFQLGVSPLILYPLLGLD